MNEQANDQATHANCAWIQSVSCHIYVCYESLAIDTPGWAMKQRYTLCVLLGPPWTASASSKLSVHHDDVIKWRHFPHYWPFVREIHRPPVNSLHKGQWRGALMFPLICVRINGWINNREAGDLRRYPAHYDVTVMITWKWLSCCRHTNPFK